MENLDANVRISLDPERALRPVRDEDPVAVERLGIASKAVFEVFQVALGRNLVEGHDRVLPSIFKFRLGHSIKHQWNEAVVGHTPARSTEHTFRGPA